MTQVYLDTNIYIYLSQKHSSFNKICRLLIKNCKQKNIILATSVETIQEIIHYSKIHHQLSVGIEVAKRILQITDSLLNVEKEIIEKYLFLTQKYSRHKRIDSRDIIHLSVSISNNIETIITYDKGFKKFKEIESLTPEEFFAKNPPISDNHSP